MTMIMLHGMFMVLDQNEMVWWDRLMQQKLIWLFQKRLRKRDQELNSWSIYFIYSGVAKEKRDKQIESVLKKNKLEKHLLTRWMKES